MVGKVPGITLPKREDYGLVRVRMDPNKEKARLQKLVKDEPEALSMILYSPAPEIIQLQAVYEMLLQESLRDSACYAWIYYFVYDEYSNGYFRDDENVESLRKTADRLCKELRGSTVRSLVDKGYDSADMFRLPDMLKNHNNWFSEPTSYCSAPYDVEENNFGAVLASLYGDWGQEEK